MSRKRVAIRDHSAEANLFARRAFFSFIIVTIAVLILFINLYHLQVEQHELYQTKSNLNRIKLQPIAPNRGLIYDRHGRLLATNKPIFNLEVIPEKVKNIEDTVDELQTLIGFSDEDKASFFKEMKRQRRFKSIPLKTNLDETALATFSVNQHRFPGVSIEARLKRYYPYKGVLTHALGYVGKINKRDLMKLTEEGLEEQYKATRDIGKNGVERYYEKVLHGKVGAEEVEVNNRGRVVRRLSTTPPVPGKDIYLTLDVELQQIAQKALKGLRGAVVVMDPKDGGILALYSNPSYDPNLFVHGISSRDYKKLQSIDRPLINRATQGRYPPASTIKPLMGLLGLESGLVTEKTTIFDPGFYQIPGSTHKYRDWKPWGHGKVDIYRSIEESCDTYFYDLAYRLGIDRISEFMTGFGFGEKTGIDIKEENSGIMPSKGWKRARFGKPWYPGETTSVGIGQSYWTTTPIQLATAITALVNRGVYYPPHLLRNFQVGEQKQPYVIEEKPPIQLKKNRHWDIILSAMHTTVSKQTGSAHKAFKGAVYDSAGKTGTAQVVTIGQDEKYDAEKIDERKRDNAMYVGFAPYDDPRIVVVIALENAGGGGSQAAPIARQVMDYYFGSSVGVRHALSR
ncbi:penicillin-binding protein 2 [Algicola sagamiensis]|uniref:penicillin-binding protein 2 n=1 Tax=Algicola sagamiensis TaxID=163869 RepID=UPI0003711505|nr:penicillin-binding protein 2 [Algicola sagamiensis]